MANTIRIKRRLSTSQSGAGAPNPMQEGELAVNFVNNRFYIQGDLPDPLEFADKKYIDDKLDGIGKAINYVATVAGGVDAANAYDLSLLTQKDTGDYYKVSTAGYFAVGVAAPFYANLNDGLVFNLVGGVDIIDNTNSTVAGTTNEISVSGSTDEGYTVSLATGPGAFKTNIENKTQNISATETVAGTTKLTGSVNVDSADYDYAVAGTQVTIGNGEVQVYKSSEDVAVKLSTEGIYRDWTFPTDAPDLKLETNKGSVLVKAQDGDITLDASSLVEVGGSGIIQTAGYGGTMGGSINFSQGGAEIKFGGGTADIFFQAKVDEVLLGAKYQAATVKVQANQLTGDSNLGPTTMDNFIIDGGVF